MPSPRRAKARSKRGSHTVVVLLGTAVAALLAAYCARDWLAGLALIILWGIWKLLWRSGEPPVLALAVSFQWVQVTCGIYYYAVTGRELEAMYSSDYRTMMALGLGCVVCLTLGLTVGLKLGSEKSAKTASSAQLLFPWRTLFSLYILSSIANSVLYNFAWSIPGFTQGLLAIGYVRLGVLFLMLRRLVRPQFRLGWFVAILSGEVVLGFTGYFAGFREPLMLAALALLEGFDTKSVRQWLRMAALVAGMVTVATVWMGIRTSYRRTLDEQVAQSRAERLERVGALSSDWFVNEYNDAAEDMDGLVDRLWAIYYPALAVSRVPDVLPYEDGAIMTAALTHLVTPRILFPEKGVLPSDSEMVRKYSGVFVAGPEENTSIAFGYAAESYIDFGVPLMFLPSLIFGVVMGVAYRILFRVIHLRELAVSLACVLFWISLYLFERSWVKTLGTSATLLIYLGGLVWLLDWRLSAVWQAKRFAARRYAAVARR